MRWVVAAVASGAFNVVLTLAGRGSIFAVAPSLGTSFWVGLRLVILSAVTYAQ